MYKTTGELYDHTSSHVSSAHGLFWYQNLVGFAKYVQTM